MSEFRSPTVILKEAELMASAPEAVAEWLKGRKSSWYDPERDDAIELALLGRNEPLIDLALARYGVSNDVLHALFSRDDLPLRVASLSNESVISKSFSFHWKFVQEGDDLGWMAKLSRAEIFALFSNPGLPDQTVSDFFGGSGAWLVLDDDQRLDAVEAITENLVARSDRDDFADGWDSYSYGKVFDSAWSFADKAPVNHKWANRLGRLYRSLSPSTFSEFKPLEAALRWHEPAEEGDLKKLEVKDNEDGYLGYFQTVRLGLARLAAGKWWEHSDTRDTVIMSDDVAIRCGGYLVFDLSEDEIKQAWTKDGKLAARYLIENDKLWSKVEKREALEEICRLCSKGDDYVVSLLRDFRKQEDRHRDSNPEWFEEESDVTYAAESTDPAMERLDSLGQRLATLQAEVKWGFLILLALCSWSLIR